MGFMMLAGGAASRSVALTISGSTNNYDVASAIAATGRSVAQGGLNVLLTIANGVIVGSTSTSVAALRTNSGWGPGCQLHVLIPSGSARIQGRGGNGGAGLQRGSIVEGSPEPGSRKGGGGGGAGTTAGSGASTGGNAGTATAGGTGGTSSGGGTLDFSNELPGSPGGPALEATSGGPNVFLEPAAGATLEVWGGGGGGGGSNSNSQPGGTGGGPGLDGSAAASGEVGGAHGKAYSTPGAATITEVGPGTIDDRGA